MQNAKQKRAQKCGHKVLTSAFCHPNADPKQKSRVSQDHFETGFIWTFFFVAPAALNAMGMKGMSSELYEKKLPYKVNAVAGMWQ